MALRRIAKKSKIALYVGVDPGKQGFICIYDGDGIIRAMWAVPYDKGGKPNRTRLVKMFRVLRLRGVRFVLIEEQHVFYKQGAVSAWTNCAGYQSLLMCLDWSGLNYKVITSTAWKRAVGLPVPDVPMPELPSEPTKGGKKALKAWEKKVASIKGKVSRQKKALRKQFAIDMAEDEYPGFDFRLNDKPKTKPHDGKCEAFLLAKLARTMHEDRRSA